MNPLGSSFHLWAWGAACLLAATGASHGGEPASTEATYQSPVCSAADTYFLEQVWTKVAAEACLKCHKPGGDADDSKFVLDDPTKDVDPEKRVSLRHNRLAFAQMAGVREGDQSRLLLKAIGKLKHGGKEALKPESTGYRILEDFVQRTTGVQDWKTKMTDAGKDKAERPFFQGISMIDDRRLLRRAALSLAGRLPTPEEGDAVQHGGLKSMNSVLDALMKEDAFYDRLAEAFNDIFLTRGYDDVPEHALDYEHFHATRGWPEKYDLNTITDAKARQKARYKLFDTYREAMLREPMELIKHIVREERPFTEIVTADYIMVSPYTARGYGVYDELHDKFHNPEDPFEYIPVRLKALQGRSKRTNQESATGFYPHAGMLTTFHYLRRYPTTETNRNRLRSRMYYQHFLGIDVLELAARVSDAAAVTAKFKVPTMEASECVICHKTVDPVAGLFQDYYELPDALFGPRKDGWFKDMFPAGLEGEDLPADQRWRALQWLGERTAKDPRFASTMVEHVYYVLTGRKTLLPPKALDDPLYDAKRRAYQAQRKEIESIAGRFAKGNFNLKNVFKEWIASPFYRADALASSAADPARRAELADLGIARMLSPEQLERKVAAIFPKPWGRLKDKEFALLYGGIDFKEVTERAADPSGAMGAIQRMMADEVACKNVALDFSTEASQRKLFPGIEPDVTPGDIPDAEGRIRQTIRHLHERVLGRDDAVDSPEVTRTYQLFAGILSEVSARKGTEPLENYSCRAGNDQRASDPKYTLRAWRAVVTYLLRRREFLYE